MMAVSIRNERVLGSSTVERHSDLCFMEKNKVSCEEVFINLVKQQALKLIRMTAK